MSPIEVKTFWTLIQPTKAKIDTLEDYSFKMSWPMANSVFVFSKFNRQPFDRTFFAFEILFSRDPCDGLSFYKCSVEGISTFLLLIFLAYLCPHRGIYLTWWKYLRWPYRHVIYRHVIYPHCPLLKWYPDLFGFKHYTFDKDFLC